MGRGVELLEGHFPLDWGEEIPLFLGSEVCITSGTRVVASTWHHLSAHRSRFTAGSLFSKKRNRLGLPLILDSQLVNILAGASVLSPLRVLQTVSVHPN